MKLLFLLMLFSVNSFAQTAEEIVKKSDEARMPSGDISVKAWVRDYKKRVLEKETTYQVWTKGPQVSLVNTLAPARQKGRKILMVNDDMWFSTPDIKRPTRISLQQKLTGEVAIGDISRTNFSGDYKPVILGEEKIKDKVAWILKLDANRKGVTYGGIKYWVEKGSFLPLKAEFFAFGGKLLKRAIYSKPEKILGATRLTSVLIQDAVQSTNESIIRYSEHKNERLDDSFFNKDNLSN